MVSILEKSTRKSSCNEDGYHGRAGEFRESVFIVAW